MIRKRHPGTIFFAKYTWFVHKYKSQAKKTTPKKAKNLLKTAVFAGQQSHTRNGEHAAPRFRVHPQYGEHAAPHFEVHPRYEEQAFHGLQKWPLSHPLYTPSKKKTPKI